MGDLAQQLEVGAAAVVKDLMKMGVMASITQTIDLETAITVAKGFGGVVVWTRSRRRRTRGHLAHLALARPNPNPTPTRRLASTLTLNQLAQP